jgi:hypothetical protein
VTNANAGGQVSMQHAETHNCYPEICLKINNINNNLHASGKNIV